MQCPSSSWKPLSNLSIQTQNLDISAWYIANANFGGCHIFAFFMLFYSHFQLINNKLGGAGRGGVKPMSNRCYMLANKDENMSTLFANKGVSFYFLRLYIEIQYSEHPYRIW